MLKGVGIGAILGRCSILIGFTALFFALGVTQFNRDI